jgi:hypothetical protein
MRGKRAQEWPCHWLAGAALVATLLAGPANGQAWAARFPLHPDCVVRPTRLGDAPDDAVHLTVRLVMFDDHAFELAGTVRIARVPEPPPTIQHAWPPPPDTLEFRLPGPGTYWVSSLARPIGRRVDSVQFSATGRYELIVPHKAGVTNGPLPPHWRCALPNFRREGENACVTTGPEIDRSRDYLYAYGWGRIHGGGKARLSENLVVVSDSMVCVEAGRRYGRQDDPPRRMLVLAADGFYFVYDPFEPEMGGEWMSRMVFTRDWVDVGRF